MASESQMSPGPPLMRGGAAVLSGTSDFTMALLDDTRLWRHRVVGELVFGSGEHVRIMSTYQNQFPPDLVKPFVCSSDADRAKVLVPVTTRSKVLLLAFDLLGPSGSSAHLLPRSSTATIQAEYLARLALTGPAQASWDGLGVDLLEAICFFTPAVYQHYLAEHEGDERQASATYLMDKLGFDVPLSEVAAWQDLEVEVGELLLHQLEEPPDPLSSSEHVLLALPLMKEPPRSLDAVSELVEGFAAGVRAASDAEGSDFLIALAEYGRRWEMLVETEVPLYEPWTLKVTEDRPLGLHEVYVGWSYQAFSLGDSQSAHLASIVQQAREVMPTGVPRVKPAQRAVGELVVARRGSAVRG